jgi:excisionase family DNA binding protein
LPAVPVASRPRAVDAPLSLGPASRLLGVDPDTLRRWADEGRIDSFTTAGGHRRFERATLERILQARRHDATLRLATLGATQDRLSRAYRRGYSEGAAAGSVREAVPTADREAFRDDGRALVSALVAHLDADDEGARDAAERDAVAATDALATRVAAAGIPLGDAVSLFVAARRPFLEELGAIARRRALDPDRLSLIYDRSSGLLDRLLLRLVATHQEALA